MSGGTIPKVDRRLVEVRHLDMRYPLPEYRTKEEWLRRARELRLHMLVSLGLYPPLPRTPLNPRREVCYEDEDVVVERVAFESLPGFFVTANLYRPKRGRPPFPAFLHPHGHVPQPEGRLYERERRRAMAMAKLGFVVLAYDMVGYGDNFQVDHRAPETPLEHLWAISKGGVQTWNSMRALDFLLSLPEVDKSRVGCCGSSGGGTQTYFLTAVDGRVAAAAPVNMVSAHMQGGCICENPPNLRVDTSNPEIAALAAPRPLLIISNGGDWTNEVPQYEFPFIKHIYELMGAPERCENAHFPERGHEFDTEMREVYYTWAVRWFKRGGRPTGEVVAEPEMDLPPAERLRVWGPGIPKPEGAPRWPDVVRYIIERAKEEIEAMRPKTRGELERFREEMGPALRHALCAEVPGKGEVVAVEAESKALGGIVARKLFIGRRGAGDRIPALLWEPAGGARRAVLLLSDEGKGAFSGPGLEPSGLAKALVERGFSVLAIDPFLIGEAAGERRRDVRFFYTYNKSDVAERVQDAITALALLRDRFGEADAIGVGEGGLWLLLARAVADVPGRTVADAAKFDAESDEEFASRLFVPCLRRVGDFKTALSLIAPRPLFVHNAHPNFPRRWAEGAYGLLGAEGALLWRAEKAPDGEIVGWLLQGQI